VRNFTRECQSHWRKNFLPYIRYVATIPCENLKHKSNTFHTNISTLHTFISNTFIETSINETIKTQQKSEAQNLCSDLFYWTRCRMVWLCDGEKKFEDMFIHFDRIHERDGWTDGRRDRQTDAAKITWGFGEGARVPCPSLGTAPVRR